MFEMGSIVLLRALLILLTLSSPRTHNDDDTRDSTFELCLDRLGSELVRDLRPASSIVLFNLMNGSIKIYNIQHIHINSLPTDDRALWANVR